MNTSLHSQLDLLYWIKGFTCLSVSLTSTGLRSYTSHKPAPAAPWCLGRCCHGAVWPFWWPHSHAPGKPPGQACPAWAGGWVRTRWPGSQRPSCSHRCTGKGCEKEKQFDCRNVYLNPISGDFPQPRSSLCNSCLAKQLLLKNVSY